MCVAWDADCWRLVNDDVSIKDLFLCSYSETGRDLMPIRFAIALCCSHEQWSMVLFRNQVVTNQDLVGAFLTQ